MPMFAQEGIVREDEREFLESLGISSLSMFDSLQASRDGTEPRFDGEDL
jgi:hypothetical protein